MSLQLILGSSGGGKSRKLYDEIVQKSIQYKEYNYIVVVPEQFTMQTQKDLVTLHPDHGIMNIDILSFLRLAYRIFEELNIEQKLVLEDTGKSMVIRKVIEEKKDELLLFQNNVYKQGFVNELKSLLSELYQYSIGPDELEQVIRQTDHKHLLQGKLKDMLVIYQGFKEFLSEKYITAEEILDVLCEVVEESNILKKSVICFDGFTGFTPSQYKLLHYLLRMCKKVIVTVTIDPNEDFTRMDEEFRLFHMSKKYIHQLYEVANEANVTIDTPIRVGVNEPYRFRNSKPLLSLEKNLFRYPYQSYKKEQDDIHIVVAPDGQGEVAYTVREILRLVREEGYRYKDIAVVTGDLQSFQGKIQKAYKKANIPCFIDLKKDITSNPLVKLIQGILEVIYRGFTYESVFRLLKNGLLPLDQDGLDQLENYVIALGIRGFKKWDQEWTKIYPTKGELNLDIINGMRQQVVDLLRPLWETFQNGNGTVLQYSKAIYEFFVKHQIQLKLQQCRVQFEQQDELLLAKEYKQVYGIVMELFDKLVELLGDDVMTIREYRDLLNSGFEEAKVGLIPPGIDQIVVGDIERTRLKDIKALFFIGVNDGIVPKNNNQGGIISDLERETLAQLNIEIAPTKRQNSFIEQFYLYLNLTKPNQKLYVTYSKVGNNGKSLRASYLIGKLEQLFPKIVIQDLEQIRYDSLEDIVAADKGFEYLVKGLRTHSIEEESMEWKELFSWYCRQKRYESLLDKTIAGACYQHEETGLSRAISKALYGDQLTNSVTRLERYAACAYAHFLSYGLDLQRRKEYEISIPDIGTIFHNAMELFSKKLYASQYSWSDIPEQVQEDLVDECVMEASVSFNNTILLSSKRNEYMIRRVKRITKRTVWALCEHVRQGEFVPSGFELQFKQLEQLSAVQVSLDDQQQMMLQGRIDRVDTYEDEEAVYVRVIDYKSGSTTLDLTKLCYGLQLQLVVYLSAAMELEEKKHPEKLVIPAGIFYYNIEDPIVEKQLDEIATKEEEHSSEWKERIEESILKELKMNGLVNSKEQVIQAMDREFVGEEGRLKGSVHSNVIPVETTKDGAIGKRSSAATNDDFINLRSFVSEKMKEFGNGIVAGDTTLNPYQLGDKTACEYCDFKGVCGFDPKLPGNNYRKLQKLSSEEAWEEIRCLIMDQKQGGEEDE